MPLGDLCLAGKLERWHIFRFSRRVATVLADQLVSILTSNAHSARRRSGWWFSTIQAHGHQPITQEECISGGPLEVQYLIKNGTIVDGTGAPAYRGDVRVRHGRIAQIAPSWSPRGASG